MNKKLIIARKYSLAFAHCFSQQFSAHDIIQVEKAYWFLHDNVNFTSLLNLSAIASKYKKNALETILFEKFQLPKEPFNALINLLIIHKRTSLMPFILKYLHEIIMEKQNIASFTINSAQVLTQDQQEQIKNFLAQSINKTIIYTYTIDKDLIAGLRLQSNTYLWEHSLKKYLRNITLTSSQ